MYGVIRTYRMKRDKLKELDRIVNNEFVPIVSKLPGYVAYFGVDQGDGKWASVSMFNSEEEAKASIKAAADFVQKRVQPMVESGPDITTGVVAVVGASKRAAAAFEQSMQTH